MKTVVSKALMVIIACGPCLMADVVEQGVKDSKAFRIAGRGGESQHRARGGHPFNELGIGYPRCH